MIEAAQDMLDAQDEAARKADSRFVAVFPRDRLRVRGRRAPYLDDQLWGIAGEDRRSEHGRCVVLCQGESARVRWTQRLNVPRDDRERPDRRRRVDDRELYLRLDRELHLGRARCQPSTVLGYIEQLSCHCLQARSKPRELFRSKSGAAW
jgi:hypothetical protein